VSDQPDEFEEFIFYEAPPPWKPPVEPVSPKRNYLTPIIAILLVAILVGGGLYSALVPFLNIKGTTDFTAILTGIVSANDCDDVPHITPYGAIQPTKSLCVCGRLFTPGGEKATFVLRLKDSSGDTITTRSIRAQKPGVFCQRLKIDRGLSQGRYVIEMSPSAQSPPVAWLHFSVAHANQTAYLSPYLARQSERVSSAS